MRKIILIAILTSIFQLNLIAAEVGTKHEYGLSFLGSYEYDEPKLMNLRSGSQAADKEYGNLGFLYNYKNAFLNDFNFLNELEFDASYQFLTQTYWSNATGTMDDIDTEILNLRALYGIQLSDKLMLKSGLGYRYLYHFWENSKSSTGHSGYDREQFYTYIPIIAELKMPIPELKLDGKLKLEFDQILKGNNNSYAGYLGGTNKDMQFKNSDGYIWKASYEGKRGAFIYEPYYEFMYVDDSTVEFGSHEPFNTTKEIGLRVKKEFNNKRSKSSEFNKILDNDDFYFGVQLLESEVETGTHSATGTAKINEKDYGYSIVSGMNVLDKTNGKLDVELAYNQFGKSNTTGNPGDSFKTDGRFRNGAGDAGDTFTFLVAANIEIESYSTSLGLKPSFDVSNGINLNANFGFTRWNQMETEGASGASPTQNTYDGIDTYYGFGLGFNSDNLTLGLEYLEHDMYYDAKTMSASLKYNF